MTMTTNKALQDKTVLFKTLFGSKLYGTNTPTSDEDWKEVFLPDIKGLLLGRKTSNVVYSTGNDKTRNNKDDVDYEYIPIQVFASDFIGGQTYAVELAFAVLSTEYKAQQELFDPMFLSFVKELTEKFLTSNIKAMIGYAMNQAQIYGIKGTRLASVRKFTDRLAELVNDPNFDNTTRLSVIEDWVKDNADKYMFMTTFENMDKKLPGVSILEKIYPLSVTVQEAYERTLALKDKYGSRAEDAESAKGIDWKATSHAIRITQQAIKVLKEHKLEFPFPEDQVKILLSIKNGEKSFAEVEQMMINLFAELDVQKEQTTLPERNDVLNEKFDTFMKFWMMKFYKQDADL